MSDFDHSRFTLLPEYAAASAALNALAHALPDEVTRPEFLQLVTSMAWALPYSDCCEHCDHRNKTDWGPHAPHGVEISRDGWVTGAYRCPQGHTWTCGYALNWWQPTA